MVYKWKIIFKHHKYDFKNTYYNSGILFFGDGYFVT